MRLFIALDFEDKQYFSDIQKRIISDAAKLTLTNTFHLTLKFLGEVKEEDVDEIKDALKAVKFEKFSILTDKTGVFPDYDYIKVVWLGLKDGSKVLELQQRIEKALEGLFPKDDRFHPHITLARVKFVKDRNTFAKAVKEAKAEPKEFNLDCFKLIKSTLTPEGPVYEDLEEYS